MNTPMQEKYLEEMNKRNIERAKKMSAAMGDKWVLHKSNAAVRKDARKNILDIPRFLLA